MPPATAPHHPRKYQLVEILSIRSKKKPQPGWREGTACRVLAFPELVWLIPSQTYGHPSSARSDSWAPWNHPPPPKDTKVLWTHYPKQHVLLRPQLEILTPTASRKATHCPTPLISKAMPQALLQSEKHSSCFRLFGGGGLTHARTITPARVEPSPPTCNP